MPSTERERHPLAEEIADYFGGRLSSQREMELDLHFGTCDECAVMAREVRILSYAVSRWSAASHRRAIEESRVLRALERASAAPACAAWHDRLSRWAGSCAGRSEAALRVALRETGDTIKASMSGLTSLTRPGALWPDFMPQVEMATRGPQDTDDVINTSEDAPRIRVSARGDDGKIEVDIEGVPSGPPPLVMLVPHEADGKLRLAELHAGPLPAHFVAVFDEVGVGTYTLVIEPRDTPDQPSQTGDRSG